MKDVALTIVGVNHCCHIIHALQIWREERLLYHNNYHLKGNCSYNKKTPTHIIIQERRGRFAHCTHCTRKKVCVYFVAYPRTHDHRWWVASTCGYDKNLHYMYVHLTWAERASQLWQGHGYHLAALLTTTPKRKYKLLPGGKYPWISKKLISLQ